MNTAANLIASANTFAGFAIGIVADTDRTGSAFYRVVRMDAASRYVTITVTATEADARKAANAEYRADMLTAA